MNPGHAMGIGGFFKGWSIRAWGVLACGVLQLWAFQVWAQDVDSPTIRVAEYGSFAETPFFVEERTNHLPVRLPDRTCLRDADCRWTLDETKLHLRVKASRGRKIVKITKQLNREEPEMVSQDEPGVSSLIQPVFPRPSGIRVPCRSPGEPLLSQEQEENLTVEATEAGIEGHGRQVERSTSLVIMYRFRCLKDPSVP
ncbi:MAG: hypothetical protein ACUVS3_09905 [Thermodesulfobacteriota bacterium]